MISYCCWLAFEVCFVYFMFPETFGRTLEELAFSTYFPLHWALLIVNIANILRTVFEDKRLADEAVAAVEKIVQQREEHLEQGIMQKQDVSKGAEQKTLYG